MDLEHALADVVGAPQVLTDPELKSAYERDYTGRYQGEARLVVRPADTAQVAGVVAACARHGDAIVAQGGNTGLVGASVPRGGEVVISLERLTEVGEVDTAVGQVTVGAGASLATLQGAARAAGLDAGLDFGARDSCTVGGVVACDAGGARALRHGTARVHVAGLEAVLADGSVISRLTGLTKDNAGYDLPALLVGSEGTLGIVTRVRWRLVPLLSSRVAVLVPLGSAREAAELLAALRARAPSLESCDFFLDEGLRLVLEHQHRQSPLRRHAPVYVLAECAAPADPTEELAAALESAGVDDAIVADDTASREGLWQLREGLPDAINAVGIPHKLDVGVPLGRLDRFLEAVPEVVRAAGGERTILFGHLGDGNVHVNVLGAAPGDARVDDAVLELALECGGTISAEHGVGMEKAHWLERARGVAEVAAMRAVKDALDPAHLLNPGAVLVSPQG
ncbi:MAG TPA: FAD-binding oxidoreductase [Solirubrobacteraceae bacterium]|jgi:FAD/FMN-containing dehydrogenase|nr:FAD-binding oxidoreductase [Solirubrobacteraceae bacterium]